MTNDTLSPNGEPQYRVIIGGKELKNNKEFILSIDINMSASSNANDCQIVLAGKYNDEQSSLENDPLKKIQVGKKAEVKLGYSSLKTVFIGYINTVSVSFDTSGVLITANCIDARGLLMGNYSWENHKNETYAQIVNAMLSPLANYCSGVDVSIKEPSGDTPKEIPKVKKNTDDFAYLTRLATRTKSSFCMVNNRIKFVSDLTGSGSVVANYEYGKNLLGFSRTVNLSNQVGSVVVTGKDPNTLKTFSAKSKSPNGKTGAKLFDGVKKKVVEIESSEVQTTEQAQKLADSTMMKYAMTLVKGSVKVLGNPDLQPFSQIRVKGIDNSVDGVYNIKEIHHSFSGAGFISDITFDGYSV